MHDSQNCRLMSLPKIIISEDGSHTLLSREYNVTYHSSHGSVQESTTIFMDAGLQYQLLKGLKIIRVFEMGFGTGLNAILSYLFSKNNAIPIMYTGVEAYPIPLEIALTLNFPEVLGLNPNEILLFGDMHRYESFEKEDFAFIKIIEKVENIELKQSYDVIFFDAFAPDNQPHLWEKSNLSKMYELLNPGGILVTYCAKGAFKRLLKEVGFLVESLPGPIGKREMTRAVKI